MNNLEVVRGRKMEDDVDGKGRYRLTMRQRVLLWEYEVGKFKIELE